jgi:hypothetical protein
MQKAKSFSRDFRVTPMPRFLDPFSESKGFGFKARGLQDTCHRLFIFQIYSKSRQGRIKTNVTLSLIL